MSDKTINADLLARQLNIIIDAYLEIAPQIKLLSERCDWTIIAFDGFGTTIETACGKTEYFNDNHTSFNRCPYCGRRLK